MTLPPRRRRRVVLVDDDDSLRRALARTIRLAGFEVDAYESAEALLAHGRPGGDVCLVLDIHLPGVGGPALQHILAMGGVRAPTVFITALPAGELHQALAGTAAAVTILHKPFGNDVLIDAIERAS